MKKIYVILLLILCSCNFLAFSQEVSNRKDNPDVPMIFVPKNHDPNFLKAGKISEKSFYQRKSEWQHIIDSTWGPGDEYARKLGIFKTYAYQIHDIFDGFISLNLNYDSLYSLYLDKIKTSTSKGAFSSIMSHFAYDLKDPHTTAWDNAVVFTALNPGLPLLLIGSYISVEHFGAVTTVLPDSTTLVLRVVPNHPLNLQPGDIILGYEGVPWKNLVRELLDAGLPMAALTGGCKSADTYLNLFGAGINWHLFSTIDILKFSTGDTLHLPVLPLVNLNVPTMVNNEQLAIQNIPFPKYNIWEDAPSDTVVTYGILENTNIGYIFLAKEPVNTGNADLQFYNAINALKNTDALIIDMRFNGGGWALFDKAFNILFNEYHKTLEHAYRCNTNTFDLCPGGNWVQFQINGKDPDYYDRPIAVLLGPTCMSMGDLTAQRLRYHPMVRFFGASSAAAHGWLTTVDNFPGWRLFYSGADMFHTSQPGVYLNRREFPIDYPVWFNKDDVAKGIDPVVEKSLEWINNLAYGHDVTVNNGLFSSVGDTATISAIVENPDSHELSAKLIFESLDGSVTDSTDLVQMVGKGEVWQGKWKTPGPAENTYWISSKIIDNTSGTFFTSKHATRITTIPLLLDNIAYATSSVDKYTFKPYIKNAGTIQKTTSLSIHTASNDPWVKSIVPDTRGISEILPGQIKATSLPFTLTFDTASFPGFFNLKFTVSSDNWPYWEFDTLTVITGIKDENVIPLSYSLDQNYPNPFNPSTSFSFSLPTRSFVSLKVFDQTGKEVATIVSEELSAGKHSRPWNVTKLPGGIYFYRLQAGQFTQTKKLVLMK